MTAKPAEKTNWKWLYLAVIPMLILFVLGGIQYAFYDEDRFHCQRAYEEWRSQGIDGQMTCESQPFYPYYGFKLILNSIEGVTH